MPSRRPTGAPVIRIGHADVERVENTTRELRAADHRYGGGSCYKQVLSALPRARMLLDTTMSVTLTRRLDTAVADLHTLAGWTIFDNGTDNRAANEAMHHFYAALELAVHAGNSSMAANIRYRMGRVHLHFNSAGHALAEFELGQRAARNAGSKLASAILSANQAWAYAKLGRAEDAIAALGAMQNEFEASDRTAVPSWAAFFTETEATAMMGCVFTDLARFVDPAYAHQAAPALDIAVKRYGAAMARSRALALISLAVDYLLLQDVDHAVDVGRDALVLSRQLRSARLRDRFQPLETEAREWSGADELSEEIRTLLPA